VHDQKLNKDQTMAAIHDLLRDFFGRMDAPERKAFYDAYVDSTSKYILTAIKLTTPQQKQHAQQRMQGWINDFNALAQGK
jgi:phage tail tape-measure protein